MIEVLKEHLKQYPAMQLQDVAKLLYQSEFGGGHMIADEEKSLKWIQAEFANLAEIDSEKVIEDIGDDMCRMYLSVLANGMKSEVLNQIFVISANQKCGSMEGLETKIEAFLEACENKEFGFDEKEAREFMAEWKTKGYPVMSHSQTYRDHYKPAYRVVRKSFVKVYEMIRRILESPKPFVVAIDGMCASGKSTIAELLHMNFEESRVFHVDDYFLQPHQRTEERLAEVGGNLDYERFKEEIIDCLADEKGLSYRPYNCSTQSLEEAVYIPWKPLTIIEGSYSHHPYFENAYDLRIFSEVERDEQEKRLLERNGEKMLERFRSEWIPKELAYFEKFHIKEKEDSYGAHYFSY